jgi:ubiquinone/menaquinone biosynthesis C-methylase UbiE
METQTQHTQPQGLQRRQLKSPFGEDWEEIFCPLCRHHESHLWLEAQDRLFGAPDKYRIVRCKECDLTYVNPRPTFAALDTHYKEDYLAFATTEETPWYMRPLIQGWEVVATRRRLKDMEKVLGRISPDMRFLDVGCGLNMLLSHIHKQRGASGVGVDINEKAVRYVQEKLRMEAVLGTLERAGLGPDQFDVATMLHYLEHEGDPRRVLAEVRRVLKPHGYLVIEIPDATGWPPRVFKDRWASLDIPRHLVFFCEDTLRRALAEEGFELVSYKKFGVPFWTGMSVYYMFQQDNRVDDPVKGLLGSTLLGSPFVPITTWTHEFAFAIARVVK